MEESPVKSTEVPFGEKELQEWLGKLKVYQSLEEALGPEVFSAYSKAMGPRDTGDFSLKKIFDLSEARAEVEKKTLEECFLTKAKARLLVFERDNKRENLAFVEVFPTQNSARIIYVLDREGKKESDWPIRNFIIVDNENGRAVDLLDVLPEGIEPRFSTERNPIALVEEKVIYLGPGKKGSFLLMPSYFEKLVGHDVEASLHEIAHALKWPEEVSESSRTMERVRRKLPPKIALALNYRFIFRAFLPFLRLRKEYIEIMEKAAEIDRKASAIAIRFIRRMRQLGVDPLPEVSNQEILSVYKLALATKDLSYFGEKKVFSR